MATAFYILLIGILHSVEGYNPPLLFANRKEILLVDSSSERGNTSIVVEGLEDAAAVDFLFQDGYIFWSDVSQELIKRTSINGSTQNAVVISSGLGSPDGLACDWLARKLYWTDSETKRIEVSNLDGSFRKVLFWKDMDQPRAIALHPVQGYLFWTDWGEVPKIEKAAMDGHQSSRSVIIDEDIHWPNGLTIDYLGSKIFWADAELSYIHSCDFDGMNRKAVVEGKGVLPHPFAITLGGDYLYWTDWKTHSIHTCNKNDGKDRRVVLSKVYSPMDIHVYSSSRQGYGDRHNNCSYNNGGCSHLCLMSPYPPYFTCACPTGVRLTSDQKTCADGAEEVVLLVRRRDLRRISLDMPDYTDVVLPLHDIKHSIAVDYDPVEGLVFWTDDEVQAIRRATLDGKNQETIIRTEVDHPDGIAVDWIGRNVFWTDTGTDRIEVARLNGTSRRVLISEGLDEPRAICLDPVMGYMYWTDWGKNAKIERANMDGSKRKVLIGKNLGWPNGISIDYVGRKLYWGDAETDLIEFSDLNGYNRGVLVKDNLPHIFGFSLLGDYIYWTDWQRRSIERVNKYTGENRTVIVDHLPDIMGLKAVNVKKVEGTNPCAIRNGGCSHLCLMTFDYGATCACPMGLELQIDMKTCIVPEAFLLFTKTSDIRRMSLEVSHRIRPLPIRGVKQALAIDFDFSDDRIYWTDASAKTISRAFLNGSSVEHIIEYGLHYPEGMAVDWVAKNVYWIDSGSNRIEVARTDGSSRRVLVWNNLSSPRALAVDPGNGYMYWTDWGSPHKLERANLDGSNRITLKSNFGKVYGLAIDYLESKLYWADLESHSIVSADMDGNNMTPIIHGHIPHPFGLALYKDQVYWTDVKRKTIERAHKYFGTNRTTMHDNVENVVDILIFHASRQEGHNVCSQKNGGCSHLCMAHPVVKGQNATWHCACPTHFKLNQDNRTCSAPKAFLLFGQKSKISRLVIDGSEHVENSPDVVLPIPGLKNMKGLAYDPMESYIYWIEGKHWTIKKALENTTQAIIVMPNTQNEKYRPYDLAIDPYSRTIYWTCSNTNQINVTRLDGRSVGVVVQNRTDDLIKPRYIVLHPVKGLMFWTNMARQPSIERSVMDGKGRVTLFNSDLKRPGPLAIDTVLDRLFWADNELNRIESSDLLGGQRKVLVKSELDNVKGLAIFGSRLFWIEKTQHVLASADKLTGANRSYVLGRLANLTDLVVVNQLHSYEIEGHPCGRNNGNCSHICVAEEGKAKCSCPIDLVLKSNFQTCSDPPTCSPEQFTCISGDIDCIPRVWRCDGLEECQDGSDERNCPKCDANEFQCENEDCIPEKDVCDGVKDCDDGSDEAAKVCCPQDKPDCRTTVDPDPSCNENTGSGSVHCTSTQPKLSKHTDITHYILAIVVGLISLVIIVIVVIVCKRKSQGILYEDRDLTMLTKPLNAPVDETPPDTLPKRTKPNRAVPPSLSGSGGQYDRNHLTGASSGSSETHYPKETLNPPPSPVTDRSVCMGEYCGYSTNSPSTVRSYKTYRHMRHIPPPPTTPCSTDVCEESEPYPPSASKKYYSRIHHRREPYDYDPFAPPPTPRSHYLSDDMSCPPSPSTERSFFNPHPPPPSPVNNSDC